MSGRSLISSGMSIVPIPVKCRLITLLSVDNGPSWSYRSFIADTIPIRKGTHMLRTLLDLIVVTAFCAGVAVWAILLSAPVAG